MIPEPTTTETTPPLASTKKRRHVMLILIMLVALALLIIVPFNLSRERGKDTAVYSNLESILTQARFIHGASRGYGNAEGTACDTGIFADPTILAALIAIRSANDQGEVVCVADTSTFHLVVRRPSLGFYNPSTPYWCADSEGSLCGVESGEDVSPVGMCACSP